MLSNSLSFFSSLDPRYSSYSNCGSAGIIPVLRKMGIFCDFCKEQRSTIYCQSDNACLCLSCDKNIHSANDISRRHLRTLLCEKCNSQPAILRFINENISICEKCDVSRQGNCNTEAISWYTGCPSVAEFSKIWSFVLEKGNGNDFVPRENDEEIDQPKGKRLLKIEEMDNWVPFSSAAYAEQKEMASITDNKQMSSSKVYPEDDDISRDFNMAEMDLCMENYEGMFENEGLFDSSDVRGTDIDTQSALAYEVSSAPRIDAMQPSYINSQPSDYMTTFDLNPTLTFPKHAHSINPFSTCISGETATGDYQASLLSPMLNHFPESSSQSAIRESAVLRYKEKKKTRKL